MIISTSAIFKFVGSIVALLILVFIAKVGFSENTKQAGGGKNLRQSSSEDSTPSKKKE